LSESISVDPWLKDAAVRLLAPLGWHGVAMLEYKQDCRTGDLFLMEVNGRFWGSLQLAVDAGVDFPYLTFQLALGQRPDVPASYKLGVKSRWLLGDVDHLLLRLRNSDRALNLPETAPSRLRTVMEFLKFAQTELHYETFTRSDLRPFVHELSSYARDLWTSSTQRLCRTLVRTAVGCGGVARTPIPK
jgi:hypothetical protein